jgi:integrase
MPRRGDIPSKSSIVLLVTYDIYYFPNPLLLCYNVIYNIRLYHTANPIDLYTKMVSSPSNLTRIATIKLSNFSVLKEQKRGECSDPFFDRKIEDATEGLKPDCYNQFYKISQDNALTIANYIFSMKSEINPADKYRRDNIILLARFSIFHDNKVFKQIIRDDVLSFLHSLQKSEEADPLHKWIGTYNLFRIYLLRFFKWLYSPDIEPDKRLKPAVIENIPQLKRKEKSVYKPTDLWTADDDILFLKFCPSKRIKCFHMMSFDTGCRPHEILKLRIRDIVFKSTGARQYAEVSVNGKTGSRHVPLIDSIPYVKDYLDNEHPQPGNPNAIFISGVRKSIGRSIDSHAISIIYAAYKKELFPKLLQNPNVQLEDKQKIKELLKKPWNPYIRRHSALTEKSKILKEHTLRQFAGWAIGSNMPQKYLHYFGNEASESLLEAYGIVTKDSQQKDALRPKQCPNCNELNKPDGKFCVRCRMILSYDAYEDTVNNKQEKEDAITMLSDQVVQLMTEIQELKNKMR